MNAKKEIEPTEGQSEVLDIIEIALGVEFPGTTRWDAHIFIKEYAPKLLIDREFNRFISRELDKPFSPGDLFG